jgi:hypothetical protein
LGVHRGEPQGQSIQSHQPGRFAARQEALALCAESPRTAPWGRCHIVANLYHYVSSSQLPASTGTTDTATPNPDASTPETSADARADRLNDFMNGSAKAQQLACAGWAVDKDTVVTGMLEGFAKYPDLGEYTRSDIRTWLQNNCPA